LPIDTLPRTHNTFCESFAAVDGARDWNSLLCSSLHPRDDMTYNVWQFNSIGNWS